MGNIVTLLLSVVLGVDTYCYTSTVAYFLVRSLVALKIHYNISFYFFFGI